LGNAVLSDSFNSFYSVIGGGLSNRVSTAGRATIGGGGENRILLEGHRATIGGGADNVIDGSGSTISGGESNSILGPGNPDFATIGGGEENGIIAECHYSTVAGGRANLIEGFSRYSSVGGGVTNTVLGADFGTIGGGATNSVTGHFAVVPGGRQNRAESNDSLAAGRRAVAAHAGSFVWADSTDADFSSLVPNEVALRASGGMRVIGSPTNAVLMVAPNETGSGDDSQITLGEDLDGTFGMSIRYDGGPNELQIYGHSGNTLFGPHVVITRNAGNVGIGRVPAANALEVEGAASKTVAGDWLANSDARIKQDIQPVQDALETLNRVRLVSFRYTDAYASSHPAVEDRRYLNVVAQEFAEVFPEHVKRSGERLPDGSEILQVDAYPLTIYSAAAVQELSRMLEVRQKEITELKQTVAELARVVQAMNDKLEGGAQ
jgi:hypothetical protein